MDRGREQSVFAHVRTICNRIYTRFCTTLSPVAGAHTGLDLFTTESLRRPCEASSAINPSATNHKERQNGSEFDRPRKDYLTPDVLSKLSGLVGESPAATQKAVGAIVPSLAGVACNQASIPGGASKILGLLNTSGLDSSVLNNFSGALSGGPATEGLLNTGSNLVHGLLGDKMAAVANVISSYSASNRPRQPNY